MTKQKAVSTSTVKRGRKNENVTKEVTCNNHSAKRAARLDFRAKIENSLKFEGFSLSLGVRELSQRITDHFAVPEWSEYQKTEEIMRATFPTWNDEQINAAVRGAAKNAGVDLSAPLCTVARVLSVIRANYLKEFVSLVGMSFAKVRDHIRENGLNNYNWRLSVGVVRSDSDIKDFIESVPVAPGSSASAVVSALFSLADVSDFNRRLSAARSSDRSDYSQYIGLAVRLGKRLGYNEDRVLSDIKYDFNTCSTSDNKQRKQLRENIKKAVETINTCNDLILSFGGVTIIDSVDITAKSARQIKSALKKRGLAYSVIATCEKLLDM